MKTAPAILFFLAFPASLAFCQSTIKGRVVVSITGSPVPGCSVFINNTSKGTVADKDGLFELNNIPPGKHELIASSIGFETSVYAFNAEQLPLRLRIGMDVKVKVLSNVVVEPSEEGGWDRWGKLFNDYFIGNTPNAAFCKIKNEKAIRFRYFRKSNRLVAYADEPILLENRALGYRISYQLAEFEINFKTRVALFYGYPLFEDMDPERKGRVDRWQRNRDKAFYGSMMHFMRSLYADSLLQRGFEVRRVTRIANREKERVKKLYQAARIVVPNSRANGVNASPAPQRISPDSMNYYERIMRQEDYKENYAKDLLTADSLIIREEGAYKILFFTDYLYITYKNELEERDYVASAGENRRPGFQRSYINLISETPVIIDINGNYPPQDILASAYWGWSEKMADFLPLDYNP